MVIFDACSKCGGLVAHKDGRPKCIFCGNEDELKVTYNEVNIK